MTFTDNVQHPWSEPKALDTTRSGFDIEGLWSAPKALSTITTDSVWNMVDEDGKFIPLTLTIPT